MNDEIIKQVKESLAQRARNYTGHTVKLTGGKVHMEKALEKKKLAKYMHQEAQAKEF